MASYATVSDVTSRYKGTIDTTICETRLADAGIIIDAYNPDASADAKNIVSCNMVIRALAESEVPIGASQGSMSAMGYSQSWTMSSGGATGEMYLSKLDKKLLGVGNRIGSHSPVEELK